MAAGSINFGGLASGLDTDRIIRQLVNARSYRVQDLQSDQKELEGRKELLRQLNSTLKDVKDAAETVNNPAAFKARSATSDDSAQVGVSAEASAELGTFSVGVTQVAEAHTQLVGTEEGTAEAGVQEGIADKADAALIRDGATVSFHHGGSAYSYTTDSATTLEGLASDIEGDDNGVSASVVNLGTSDSPEYALKLKSDTTGAGDNRITTDGNEANPGILVDGATTGTLFQDSGGNPLTTEQETTQAGVNANFSVDGVDYTRTTNSVDDAIQGLTLNLKATTGGQKVDVAVSRNLGEASGNVKSLVEAYNKAAGFLNKQTAYDPETGRAGPLNGSALARGVESQLRTAIGARSADPGDSGYTSVLEVGVDFGRDGTLSFDEGEFEQALESSPEEVRALFIGEDGLAGRLEDTLRDLTSATRGTVPSQLDTLNDRIRDLGDDIQRERERLDQYEQRQVERFAELEKTLAQFQSQQAQLTSALSKLPSIQ